MSSSELISLLVPGLYETLYMVIVSTIFAYIIGLPIGIMLVVMDKDGIFPLVSVQRVLGVIVNILRSVPFLILLITIMPITRAIVGTSVGYKAAVVPLVVAAAPYIARLVESSIREVDNGVIEAVESMGASPMRIIRVMLLEARPSLLVGCAIAVTTILGYSAMAGIVGGGGLGAIAINYGYYRKDTQIMLVTVIVIVIVVQILQELGMRIATIMDKRK